MLAAIAGKLAEQGERLLLVSEDEAQLASLDRILWEEGGKTSFLAHGIEGQGRDADQPVLLSTRMIAANSARNVALADGSWRAAALDYERAFMLFDDSTIAGAREAWKSLGDTEGVERHYWAREEGKWVQKA
ncbi:DNA polymerase III subunit chi [Sphingomicrobium sp. GRR-S6-50]|uniref:DNA polymerase III subunit chi n=1 Tax=Sphingomicrobium sediminis TaxID=2950949 RepID=A0A9X2EHT4_9SPHN|nr:DNA polymerase III subunit chi [Sphingomicrobium sediminis]